MKRRRTVQPLPRYTTRVWLKPRNGAHCRWAYYFTPPTWARIAKDDRGCCPVGAEALGCDYDAAVARVERVLLPALDSWRTRGLVELAPQGRRRGTLDWLFAEYRGAERYRALGRHAKRAYDSGLALVADHVLKDGRRLGTVALSAIDAVAVDALFRKLLPLTGRDGRPVPLLRDGHPVEIDGAPVFAQRRTTANHAMKYCRRAWNVVARLHPSDVPQVNPFARMGLSLDHQAVAAASYADLLAVVAAADVRGLASLAAALMVTWEWLQREEHIFTAFALAHYRPKGRPDEVLIVYPKNSEEVWIPLFAADGTTLFPELMARMDALKRDRVGGMFFMRDWIDKFSRAPMPWASPTGRLDQLRKVVKGLVADAGLDPKLTFTSFRHGGLTELGNADLTDAQIRALSRHKSAKVLTGYIKRTRDQIEAGTRKRRATRPACAALANANQIDPFGRRN